MSDLIGPYVFHGSPDASDSLRSNIHYLYKYDTRMCTSYVFCVRSFDVRRVGLQSSRHGDGGSSQWPRVIRESLINDFLAYLSTHETWPVFHMTHVSVFDPLFVFDWGGS